MLLLLFFIFRYEEYKISSLNSLLNFGIFSFVCRFLSERFRVLIHLCFSPHHYITHFEQYFCVKWPKFGPAALILIKFFAPSRLLQLVLMIFIKLKNLSTLVFEKGIQNIIW